MLVRARITVKPVLSGVLSVGRRYRMEVTARNVANNQATRQTHDVYIYEPLRQCTITARDITELEEVGPFLVPLL